MQSNAIILLIVIVVIVLILLHCTKDGSTLNNPSVPDQGSPPSNTHPVPPSQNPPVTTPLLISGSRSNGSLCLRNSDCSNGKCGRYGGSLLNTLRCCPSNGMYQNETGQDFCTGLPNGEGCNDNRACQSGRCRAMQGNLGPSTAFPGICSA